MTTPTPSDLWATALIQLENQMTRATFDTWLKGTHVISNGLLDGQLTVGVHTPAAKDWLDNRLRETIERTLSQVAGREIAISFQVAAGQIAPPVTEAEAVPQLDPTILSFDTYEHGYQPLPHYIQRFWGAYLGAPALQLWSYIRAFDKEPRYSYKKGVATPNPNWTPWTPVQRFRPADLARALQSKAGSTANRKKVTGAWRICHRFNVAYREGNVWESCRCGLDRGQMARIKPTVAYPDGRWACRYWDPGVIEQLESEHILLAVKAGTAAQPRASFYDIQVYHLLPLLSRSQAASLNEATQLEHRQYLSRHGLDIIAWQSLDYSSLLPLICSWEGVTLNKSDS